MKLFLKALFLIFSFLFFLYLVWPFEPKNVYQFSPLPGNCVRSKLSGDTVQVPNLTAFFSNSYRSFVSKYYRNEFQYFTKLPFVPLRLNYPPEEAFTYIKDQTQSTYLEEYTYPFRGSLFVNGLEPFDEQTKEERFDGATYFEQDDQLFETKVTIRYYPSSPWARALVWLGINFCFYFIYFSFNKIKND